jgi:hypothetical protein
MVAKHLTLLSLSGEDHGDGRGAAPAPEEPGGHAPGDRGSGRSHRHAQGQNGTKLLFPLLSYRVSLRRDHLSFKISQLHFSLASRQKAKFRL